MNIPLYELADETRESYAPSSDEDIPYIGLEHVEPNSLHISSMGSSLEVQSQKFKFQMGDILFGTLRPYFRKVIVASCDGVCSTEFSVVRPKKPEDRNFVFYAMANPQFISYATTNSNGARPRTKWKLFSNFTLYKYRPLQRQNIGSILVAYDDLIENNRRRIQLLEQAARLLYKEWFVRLRFPGHEHVKIVNGIPEGWKKKTLGECAPLNYGKALKEDNRIAGRFHVYGSSGIVGSHIKALVSGPTIIVGRKGNVGSVYWSQDDCHPIDTVYFIDSEHCSFFLYYALQQMNFISTDVAVPGLNRDFADSRLVLIADQKILRLFEDTVLPLHQQMELLKRQIATLAQARDLLLPRLMNGEIAV